MALEKKVGVQMDSQPVECGCYEGANIGESYLYGDDVTDKLAAFVTKSSKDCDGSDPLCPIKKLMAQKRDACLARPATAEGKHNAEFYCFLTASETALAQGSGRECGENDVLRLHRVGAPVCKQVLDPRDLRDFCHCLVTVSEEDAKTFECIAHENESGYGIWKDCMALQEKKVGVQMDSQPVECGCYEGANIGESYLYGDDVTDKLAAFVTKSSKDCVGTDPLCPIKKLMAQKRDACLARPKTAEGKHNAEFYCFLTASETAIAEGTGRECGENDVLRLHRVGAPVCKQVLDPRDLKDFCHCLVTVSEEDAKTFECIAHENESGYGIWKDCM